MISQGLDDIFLVLADHGIVRAGHSQIRDVRRAAMQLTLFPEDDALREELANLDVLSLSPLEALNKLFQVVEKAKGAKNKETRA